MHPLATASVLGFLAAALPAVAVAPEFQVNQSWLCTQYPGGIAATGDGGFAIVWGSVADSGSPSVLGRRFAADATPLTGEWTLDDRPPGDAGIEFNPAVAPTRDGGFVAVWERWFTSPAGLRGRIFPPSPAATAPPEFAVSGDSDAPHWGRVGTDQNGTIVVAWLAGPSTGLVVKARRFTAGGDPLGPEIAVSGGPTSQPGGQPAIDLAVAADGSFLVVWKDLSPRGLEVFGRAFDGAGNPLGGKSALSNTPADPFANVRAAARRNGRGYLIVWQSGGQPGLATELWARVVAPTGVAGHAFLLRQTRSPFWLGGFALTVGAHDFAAVWTECRGSAALDNLHCHPHGERYSPGGTPIGSPFRLNTYPLYSQIAAEALLLEASADLVAVWESLGANAAALCGTPSEDGDASGVFARRFPAAPRAAGGSNGNEAVAPRPR
jgi:hypothetical protein